MSNNYIKESKEEPIYDIKEADKAQRKYCEENHLPFFAPLGGKCWSCGHNIYGDNGYSVQYASRRLITGCPHCHRTYCD